jgi:hypothetical protein
MKKLIAALVLLAGTHLTGLSQTFTDSNLPIVMINTDGAAPIPDAPRVFGTMKIINRGNGQRNYLTDMDSSSFLDYNGRIAIEIRGSSSQVTAKKQYGFSTLVPGDTAEANVSLLGFPKDNDWVLNGMVWDPMMMRDYICYNLFRRMGEYASRTAYCEVVLNNSYLGLYLLQEKVKQGDSRVNVTKMKKSDYFLPNLTGGYIVKSDRGIAIWTMLSYASGQDVPFVNVDPAYENATQEQNRYIMQQFVNLQNATLQNNTSDENGYQSIIDVPSFIDYMLLTEYSSNADNYQISTYYHKDRNGKLRAGPIWDSDLTFGNDLSIWGLDRSHTDVWQFANGDNQGPMYWRDLFGSIKYRCSMFKRFSELTGPGGAMNADTLSAFIDRTKAYISEAFARNNTFWRVNPNMETGTANMKSWIRTRIAWMNTFAPSAADCPDPVIPPLVITRIMYHPDSTASYPKRKDYEFIEIKNTGNKIINMSGDYFLGTGFVYVFPPYSVVNPGGSKILASNEAAFRQKYGFAPSGQFTRSLGNGGEKIALADPFGNLIDLVEYSDNPPWPNADGNGAYLELTDTGLDNNDPLNWKASFDAIMAAEKLTETDRPQVYPVPAHDLVTFSSGKTISGIEIYNMQGLLLRSYQPETEVFNADISNLAPGIYYARVTAGGSLTVSKIVKE